MYNVKVTEEEKKRIATGNVEILLHKLRESNERIIVDLKNRVDDIRFLQGSSRVIDELIRILEVNA